jgi:hypothetical protein
LEVVLVLAGKLARAVTLPESDQLAVYMVVAVVEVVAHFVVQMVRLVLFALLWAQINTHQMLRKTPIKLSLQQQVQALGLFQRA